MWPAVILLLSTRSFTAEVPREKERERAELAPSGGNGLVASQTRGSVSEYSQERAASGGRAYDGRLVGAKENLRD